MQIKWCAMVPIWKRKWGRLANVDGQHSRPLPTASFKNDTQSSKAANLEANIRLYSIDIDFFSVVLMDSPGFVDFRDVFPI
jgi:hypothetical protein